MAEEGCLLRAIELSKNSDELLRVLGLGTIRHLCINTRVKRPFYEQGGLGPVFMGIEDKSQNEDLLTQVYIYIYIYIYMCINIYIYVYLCINLCIFIKNVCIFM
jgi:hypothetical protein